MKEIYHSYIFMLFYILVVSGVLHAADLSYLYDSPPKYHEEIISNSSHRYSIQMKGKIDGKMTRDPVGYWAFDQYWEPNVYVKMENIGDTPIINPWLHRLDKPDTRSLKSIVNFVIKPGMTDAEKAQALFEFEIQNRFHATSKDTEVDDAIKRINCYGYTLCGNESKIISDLWRTAGLPVRQAYPNGHSTAEVYYDDQWHLLDTDEHIFCLLRDNKTITSASQVVADHDLMKRTHTYGVAHPSNRLSDEGGASLYYYEGKREGERPSLTKHTMDFVLRPNEALTWRWTTGNLLHGSESGYRNQRWRLTSHVMNGTLDYSPDLLDSTTDRYIKTANITRRKNGPLGPGLYAEGKTGSVIVPISSAYPIVGGRLVTRYGLGQMDQDEVEISISFDNGQSWREVYTTSGFDFTRVTLDLNGIFHKKYLDPNDKEGYNAPPSEPAHYSYLLRFQLRSESEDPAICLKSFHVTSVLQMAQLALPGLNLGKNEFIYTNESPQPGKVKITHAWRECNDAKVPGKPPLAIYPKMNKTVKGSQFAFRWEPPSGNIVITDYEFQLSAYPDMRWVLSPNFHRLISRTPQRNTPSYEIPYTGLLNPGQTYYWRIRARSQQGIWGHWSRVFSFTVQCPAVPVNPQARLDQDSRTAKLSWKPGSDGSKPAYYKVYGSNEQGFTASDTAYRYNAGLQGIKVNPPNLIHRTKGPVTSWTIPTDLWYPYYRIVAVDEKGVKSGPSALAELPHPLIKTKALPPAIANSQYKAALSVCASIGHLVSATENGKAYQKRFRSGDNLVFIVKGLPDGLWVNQNTGRITGTPAVQEVGEHIVKIIIESQKSGRRDSLNYRLSVLSSPESTSKISSN